MAEAVKKGAEAVQDKVSGNGIDFLCELKQSFIVYV